MLLLNQPVTSARRLLRFVSLLSLALALQIPLAEAQTTVGFQEYFILGHEEDVWNMMNRVRSGEGAGAFPAPTRMNSVISITATADGQIVTVDHWEDGFEANIGAPVQATTLVFGDGNNANGRACDYSKDPRVSCGGANEDKLFAGTAMALASDQGMGGTCATPLASPNLTQLRCSVPVPRSNPSVLNPSIRFDGGDRVFNTGGSLSIAHIQDPGTPLIGGGTELLSRELVKNAVSYSIPVGENLFPGANNAFASLKYVGLDIVAFDDNTALTVVSPGFGTVSMTLHKGQHYSTCATFAAGSPGLCTAGSIAGPQGPGPENRGVFPGLALTVNSGTKISTTGPLNALIFTGGTGSYQTRHYATLPDILHTSDYVITAPGDDTAVQGTRSLNLYIYNPSPTTAINVTTTDSVGAFTVPVPANSVVDYRNVVGRFVPNNSTVRLTSNRQFWGLSAYGITDNISDWGHSWLGVRFLTTDYTLAFSPGTQFYPVTSITCAGTNPAIATVTTAINHNINNNSRVRIAGAVPAGFNGNFQVTATNGTATMTYSLGAVSTCPAASATGTITAVGICDGTNAFPCNSYNRDPVWVAGTQNNTHVKVDFNADGIYDYVDFNSDGCPDTGDLVIAGICEPPPAVAGCTAPLANQCAYLVNAPGNPGRNTLRVWDYTDMDNAGTRIVSTKPVAMSWGQDVDQGEGSDPSPDTGYTVYPSIVVDTVLGLEKTVSPARVPLGGTVAQRTASYSLRIFAGDYGPVSNLTIADILPTGVGCGDFVAGSTVITYPDLSQNSPVPTCLATSAPDPLGRFKLTWTLTPNTLSQNQQTLVTYKVVIPTTGSARTLTNDAQATGTFGAGLGSIFRPRASAVVNQTDTSIVKTQVNQDATPEIGDMITYTLTVTNGTAADTNISISDAIPPFTSLVLGSITSSISSGTPFTGAYSAAQNAVVWTCTAPSCTQFNANAVATLSFKVTIDAGTPTNSIIPNFANFSSTSTPSLNSNTVQTVVVGPILSIVKSGPPGPLHPNEVATFQVSVDNNGSGAAPNVLLTDNMLGSNMTYVPGSMSYSINGSAFVALTDAVDADGGSFSGTTASFTLASLGSGQDFVFRFQERVNPGTGGLFATNQAQVTPSGQPSIDSNLVQIPIVGNATLTGRVFLDTNGNGAQDPGELGAVGVAVSVTDSTAVTQIVYTDANGDYIATVPAGTTTINPNETTGNIPPGSVLTTACPSGVGCPTTPNDPQNVTAVANATTVVPIVGYKPLPLAITKTSNGGGLVFPGKVVTYTVTLTNNTGATQTGIRVTDTVPANTTFVPGTANVQLGRAIRATEYYIAPGSFTGTSFNLTLAQALKADYFVIVQGSDFVNNTTDLAPDRNYISLTADPFSTGSAGTQPGLLASGAADRLTFTRGAASGAGQSWSGVVTVVECLRDCAVNGFRLRDVTRVTHAGAAVGPTAVASDYPWPSLTRLMLLGGFQGAGCDTTENQAQDTKGCQARIFPSGTGGTSNINWTRDNGGMSSMTTATSTVMTLEWGSAWTMNRATITNGNNGGSGLNATGQYNNSAAFAAVSRPRTWVWGTGHTNDNEQARASEGVAITLGNGVAQNATETVVSAGAFVNNRALNFELYTLTHPQLSVNYLFKAQNTGTDPAALTFDQATTAASASRMSIGYNGTSQNDNGYPASMFSARYFNANTLRLERRRAGASGEGVAAWVQGIDFGAIAPSAAITCLATYPPAAGNCTNPDVPAASGNIVDPAAGFTLEPGETMTVTFQVTVNANAPVGTITNTAKGASTQQGEVQASASDTNVVPGVTIEPNNAGFATAGSTITFTQTVFNRGSGTDSFNLKLANQSGWKVELIHPTTGGIVATDTNGDGIWDGGVIINTGALAPGGSATYRIRVTVPPGTMDFFKSTTELTATSVISASFSSVGTSEVTVLPSTRFGAVEVSPDQSGVVTAGSFTSYPVYVFNNTGAAATFDLALGGTQNWANTVHADTNGDGLYTPGVDVAVGNTASIPNGSSQLLFVVVNAPGGAASGTVDASILTAVSRTNSLHYDSATFTTIVNAPTKVQLSGGGSRVVVPTDTAVYPGVLYNLATSSDRFNFSLSAASLFGLDGLNHPTELWIDNNNDKIPDLLIATDSDGDGLWNTIAPGYDVDSNGQPDVLLNGAAALDYELVRTIDVNQKLPTEFVTLRATGTNSAQSDAVTAQWIIAAVTRASLRGLRVDADAGVIEFATGSQRGTHGFYFYETAARRGAKWELLRDTEVLSPRADSTTPILYRVETRPLRHRFIVIEEVETSGRRLQKGPFSINDPALVRGLQMIEARLNAAGSPRSAARMSPAPRTGASRSRNVKKGKARRSVDGVNGIRIETDVPGVVEVSMSDLEAAGLGRGLLRLWNRGGEVAMDTLPRKAGIRFVAEPLVTDYTGNNVYVLTWGDEPYRMGASLSRSGDRSRPGFQRAEREVIYLASSPEGADPWLWDQLVSTGEPWPYADWDPTGEYGLFDLPGWVAPSKRVRVRIRVLGYTNHTHTISASINGAPVGEVTFSGPTEALISGLVDASVLRQSGNRLSMVATAVDRDGRTTFDGIAYLDYVEVAASPAGPGVGHVAELGVYSGELPNSRNADYLIVTHPLFRAAADRIAGLKAAEGLRPLVVETDTIYDRYSGGIVEANAIARAVRDLAKKSGRMKYLLLLGDDTFDARDVTGLGARIFVPSLYARDQNFGRIPSENRYADLDDDGRPDLAVGRLAAQTPAEAMIMADKVESQAESLRAYRERQIFASDDQAAGDDAPFRQEAGEMAAVSGAGLGSIAFADVSSGIGVARATLFENWRQGVSQVHYFGHGGPELWADDGLLTPEDVGSDLQPALVFMWACESQLYQYLWAPSLGEKLMLTPGGGAFASFGPVGIAAPGNQRVLYEKVYARMLAGDDSLGEIIRKSKSEAMGEKPWSSEVVYGFNLLGDPALRIPPPR